MIMSSNINEDFIVDYIRSVTPKNSGILKEMEDYVEEHFVPIVEPEVAQLIKLMLKLTKPKRILEVGTAIGYSSIMMAKTLPDCKITTIERREDMIELARENIKLANLEDRIEIISGDAEEVLDNLRGEYDLIFLDAAKGQYINFFDKARKYLSSNGLIISDNVLFKGMVASDELVIRRKKTIVKRLRTYLEYINNIDGYISALIPIGDGVALTYREE